MLKQIPLFSGLTDGELNTLAERTATKSYPKHTILVSEGDETDSLYFIESGKVKVFLSDEEGKEVILNTQGPGDYFGEIALLDEAPRSASVMTIEHCRLKVIAKRDFEQCLIRHPDIAVKLLKDLSRRMRSLTDNVKSLALMDVYGRVARLLIALATEQEGRLVIGQRLTQQHIANRVGASREMVSRIMKDLTAGGYITVDKSTITINERLPTHW